MALKAYYIEEQQLDGVWLVLDKPGGEIVTTRPTQAAATAWVKEHHPQAAIHLANGVGENKWDQMREPPPPRS